MNTETIRRLAFGKYSNRTGLAIVLLGFSGMGVIGAFGSPLSAFWFHGGLGAIVLLSSFLRLGWKAPCMIAGTYFGMMPNPAIRSGTPESQMWDTFSRIMFGAAVGLAIGAGIDRRNAQADDRPEEHSTQVPPDTTHSDTECTTD